MNPIRMAVIGVGHLGRIHTRLIQGLSAFRLVGIADPSEVNRREVSAAYHTQGYAGHRHLLGQIDAAVIATPTQYHFPVALDLLQRGVHLLVEKPLAVSPAEASQLVAAARHSGVILQVGHVERFNPAFVAAQPHVGQARYVDAVRQSGFTFRSMDIGVVLDLMIHDLDLVLALAHSRVRHVSALGVALFGQHEDIAQARLEFENGCVANLSASRASRTARRRMQIWSDQGCAALDLAERTAELIRPHPLVQQHEFDAETLLPEEKARLKDCLLDELLPRQLLPIVAQDPLTAELTDFAHCIRTGSVPRVPGEQGQAALEVAQQILESIEQHAWHGTADGPRGPLADTHPRILRGPHWNQRPAATPHERREAI